jgi:hypothetical protein
LKLAEGGMSFFGFHEENLTTDGGAWPQAVAAALPVTIRSRAAGAVAARVAAALSVIIPPPLPPAAAEREHGQSKSLPFPSMIFHTHLCSGIGAPFLITEQTLPCSLTVYFAATQGKPNDL